MQTIIVKSTVLTDGLQMLIKERKYSCQGCLPVKLTVRAVINCDREGRRWSRFEVGKKDQKFSLGQIGKTS
jgi:hypothetical protein